MRQEVDYDKTSEREGRGGAVTVLRRGGREREKQKQQQEKQMKEELVKEKGSGQ